MYAHPGMRCICLNITSSSGYPAKLLSKTQSYPFHTTLHSMTYTDAQFEESSNWLRWVNTARWLEEQNMFAIEHEGDTYYLLIKDIKAGDELLGL
jgi:hemin uptake protein HemP